VKNEGADGTLRARVPYNVLVARRISQLRRRVKLDTQRLRTKTIERLDQLFAFATQIASGQMKWQRVAGKKLPITLKQRQMWAHVAAYIGQIMGNLANGYDERQMDEDLAELERLVDEIKKQGKAKEDQAGARGDQKRPDDSKAYTA